MTTKITLRHYAYREGQDAAALGYTGPNPYLNGPWQTCVQWRDGYLAAIKERLDAGADAMSQAVSTGDAA